MGYLSSFGRALILGVLASGLLACAKNFPSKIHSPQAPQTKIDRLSGEIRTTDDQTISLSKPLIRPIVLIFSTDTCLVCRGEAASLVQRFSKSGLPTNIDLFTVLIGAYLEDARDFRDSLHIGWQVGVQLGDQEFKSFCPLRKVPCVVVQTPQGGIVYQHEGEFTVELLEQYTGVWK